MQEKNGPGYNEESWVIMNEKERIAPINWSAQEYEGHKIGL